eukprot:4758416-Prymnesium_polylepis.1
MVVGGAGEVGVIAVGGAGDGGVVVVNHSQPLVTDSSGSRMWPSDAIACDGRARNNQAHVGCGPTGTGVSGPERGVARTLAAVWEASVIPSTTSAP